MLAGRDQVGRRPARQAGADRNAVAQGLGQGHHIGGDARVLVAEPGAGASQAGLDLVEHQQPAVPVAQAAQLAQVVGAGQADAAFALHGLDQHGHDVAMLGGGVVHGRDVVIGHAHEARHQRLEAALLGRVARGRQRGQRAAVKAVVHHQDLRPRHLPAVAVQARQLERGLVGLGAGVAEEGRLHVGQGAQALAQAFLPVDAEHVGGVQQQAGLLGDHGGDLRVRVAQGGHCHTGNGIQVFGAVLVPELGPTATDEGHGLAGIGLHQAGIKGLHGFLHVKVLKRGQG